MPIDYYTERYLAYIKLWRGGLATGITSDKTHSLSRHVVRYIREKYGNKCSQCGWCEVNPVTGRVPVEIHHINGDSADASEGNLTLLCPNCHSLTPSFRNLNRGKSKRLRAGVAQR